MATESEYFRKQKLANKNPLVNGSATWQKDPTLESEKERAFATVESSLNSGILEHFRQMRDRALGEVVIKQCYENEDFTYLQALRCASFIQENDNTLSQLKAFASESLTKHRQAYETECTKSVEMERAKTIAEKDRVYAACHHNFMARIRMQLTRELQTKAMEQFQH